MMSWPKPDGRRTRSLVTPSHPCANVPTSSSWRSAHMCEAPPATQSFWIWLQMRGAVPRGMRIAAATDDGGSQPRWSDSRRRGSTSPRGARSRRWIPGLRGSSVPRWLHRNLKCHLRLPPGSPSKNDPSWCPFQRHMQNPLRRRLPHLRRRLPLQIHLPRRRTSLGRLRRVGAAVPVCQVGTKSSSAQRARRTRARRAGAVATHAPGWPVPR